MSVPTPPQYQVNPTHRKKAYAGKKSQWTITESEEEAVFEFAVAKKWQASECFWGLYVAEQAVEPLGITIEPECTSLGIAKFVDKKNSGIWHGYPVASWLSNNDKPDVCILNKWLECEYINKSRHSRIHRGKSFSW